MSALAALAAQAAKDEKEERAPVVKAPSTPGTDEKVLEKAMEEFRGAPDSREALRSFRALLSALR